MLKDYPELIGKSQDTAAAAPAPALLMLNEARRGRFARRPLPCGECRALAMPPLRVARSRHARSEPARALPCAARAWPYAVSAAAPMSHAILIVVMLSLSIIAAVGIAASRLKIPPAILLVLTGVVLALIPGLPTVQLAPELVLLLVLPPMVYISGVQIEAEFPPAHLYAGDIDHRR